ncbi:MAG: peptide deformylase [Ignavibacteria bacterium]|nr:peptide deformylase [Ignavibacteria bacterium]
MILPVYTYNHPVLKQRTIEIPDLSDELNSLIDDMFATMYNANGIGLAANQVGKGLSLTVIDISDAEEEDETDGPLVLINPVVEAFSDNEEEFEEGCLQSPRPTRCCDLSKRDSGPLSRPAHEGTTFGGWWTPRTCDATRDRSPQRHLLLRTPLPHQTYPCPRQTQTYCKGRYRAGV